ncbi:MAG: protease complex subunit PrcB family protein [Lachnospiraceae bacterium]|nr:protease complex subunit PrcB family protein [Lachnospiraceae bacterium]MDD3616085.1 protease complex subunit PrcB family protein [Lachnospiraceae bacterium]
MSRIVIIVMAIISALGMAGCGLYQLKTEEEQPLEYTVVSEDNLPEMLKTMIEERKQTPFQLSYLEEDSLYMVQGYGEKETGGYDITVGKCVLAEESIHVECNLTGPVDPKKEEAVKSYPYIVLKTERREEPVIFD